MQGKGIIKVFLVAMTLICLWQLLLTFPTNKVEKKAEAFATSIAESGSKAYNDTLGHYLDSMSSEVVLPTPFKDFTYQDLKNSQLAYGLDLVGGMSVVLAVDLSERIKTLAQDNNDTKFDLALDKALEAQKNSQDDFVTLFRDAFEAENPGEDLAPYFVTTDSDSESDITVNSSNDKVVSWIRQDANKTVNSTFEMLKERIDKLGVVQPNVSLDAARDLIIVELPGIKNPARARSFLESTARLEFWPTHRNSDDGGKIINALIEVDQMLKRNDPDAEDIPETVPDTVWVLDSIGNKIYEEGPNGEQVPTYSSIGTKPNPELQNQTAGPLFSLIGLNTQANPDGSGSPVVGFITDNKKGTKKKKVMEILSRDEVKNKLPRDVSLMWGYYGQQVDDEDGRKLYNYSLYAVKKQEDERAPIEGSSVTKTGYGNNQGNIEVTLSMDQDGGAEWFKMTKKAYEDGEREIAITLDNEVVSSPGVRNGAISGGRTSISGGFTLQEAIDLSKILEIGSLPAKPRIIQEAVVGPTLGKDNTRRSLIAMAGGLALVLLFMIAYYGGAGIVSIIALLLNVGFIFGALASIGTVLTLPGIAGIVLTIGMAVDANVIIYERIREELRAGKALVSAIRDGFSNSYSAIIDANLTTFLVALVLNYFGLGPIKGFAVVLMIGVICSIFTAVLVGRLMIDWWTNKGNNLTFWTGSSKNAFANVKVDWLSKRKMAYVFSGLIILGGLVSMFTKGFELGVDFKGGYSYNVQFAGESKINIDDLKTNLKEAFVGAADPVVKAVSTANTFSITTSYKINDQSREADSLALAALYQGINSTSNVSFDDFTSDKDNVTKVTSSSKVGPTIADDIRKTAYYAGIFSLLIIFLYIMIRFSRWEYSAGAVAALFHDTLIVLSIFSIFHGILPFPMQVDQAFIAAILTVIGYSINDTVVVFDRIREFMNEKTGWSKEDIINGAIDSTISRTIITSLTTLFVIAMLFIFGRGSIQGFAFALLIGVVVGTYSSVFVATPVFHDLSGDLKPRTKKAAKKSTKGFQKPATT